jgi:hypothetical protein
MRPANSLGDPTEPVNQPSKFSRFLPRDFSRIREAAYVLTTGNLDAHLIGISLKHMSK